MDTVVRQESQGSPWSISTTHGSTERERATGELAGVVVMRPERSWWRKELPAVSVVLRDPRFVIDLDTGNS